MQYNKKGFYTARKKGYRSGLEEIIAKQIKKSKHELRYETIKIKWVDFVLDNGIIIEAKGFWTTFDRRKHLEIQRQHPNLDIRLVFENSDRKIRKGSATSYGKWCEKKKIVFCNRVIPQTWLTEKLNFMPSTIVEVQEESEIK